jgi:hypothetical protein
MQLEVQGIHAEASAANFPMLTAKMAPKDVSALKKSFARHGFVEEIEALEGEGKEFAAQFAGKGAATASQAWKLLHSAKPESVLWVAHTSKNGAIQAKFKAFYTEWPQARQKIPYTLMQEMRIVPDLAGFDDLVEKLFFELMDGKLATLEEMKAFLEPYSPPAPPPPVHLRRARVAKKDAKPAKSRKKAVAVPEGEEDAAEVAEAVVEQMAAPVAAKSVKAAAPVKVVAKVAPVAAKKAVAPAKSAPVKVAAKTPAKKVAAKAPVKKVVAKVVAKKAPAKKPAAKKVVAKKAPAKVVAKKAPAKAAAKKAVAKKAAPAKKAVKAVAKKKKR